MATWLPFAYREFYDVPRTILLKHGQQTYLLDSRFLASSDDYDPTYQVYRLIHDDPTLPDRLSWEGIEALGESIGSIEVTAVRFDSTRRELLDIESLRGLIER